MSLKNKLIPFYQIDYKKEVISELENGREITALLLIHGYIEAFLREWIFISGKNTKRELGKAFVNELERISLKSLLLIHFSLGNINPSIYNNILRLNNVRNTLAHKLIIIDYSNKVNKEKIQKHVRDSISACEEIAKLYNSLVNSKSLLLQKEMPN